MPLRIKPMLAYNGEWDINKIKYPKAVTPKLDGIRVLKQDGNVYTRTGKRLPNKYIRDMLKKYAPDGTDGEIVLSEGGTFSDVYSAVMSELGTPKFNYIIFDFIPNANININYLGRMFHAVEFQEPLSVLMPVLVHSATQLEIVHNKFVEKGYEGTIVRAPDGPYKQGRSTLKEEYMLKLVDWTEDEAKIVGLQEALQVETREPLGILGSMMVEHPSYGQFNIGSGFTEIQRKSAWKMGEEKLKGKVITFKYKKDRTKDKPSQPIFKTLRIDI